MKLRLFAMYLKNNDLSHFDFLHELPANDVEVECSRFVEDIEFYLMSLRIDSKILID